MSDHDVRMILLGTEDLDESIRFYTETLGMPLKFRDGGHFAAIDGGSVTIALATALDHPMPGKVVVGHAPGNQGINTEQTKASIPGPKGGR